MIDPEVQDFLIRSRPDANQGSFEVVSSNPNDPNIATSMERLLDTLSYISIPIAVAAVVLIGVFIIGNIITGSSQNAMSNLKKIAAVLAGLVIVMNSHLIVAAFI